MVLLNRPGLLIASATLMLVASCGRSDPLPCKDNCGSTGETRCIGEILQTCTSVDPRCHQWQDTTDCAQYNRFCQENDHGAACVKACSNACIPEGASRCNGDVVQTCAHDERGCLSWTGVTKCADFGETCEEVDGQAHCAVICEDECDVLGRTSCGDSFILTCARDFYGCLYWEYGRDCSESGFICQEENGIASCTPCVPDCSGRHCGPDPVCGTSCGTCHGPTEVCRADEGVCVDACAGKQCGNFEGVYCGSCQGPTEVCRQDTGICENVCSGRQCGTVEGKFCGDCPGATEVCREDSGICEDVCQWRECGVTEGIDCGTCPGDEICITGQCFAPVCEGGMCQVPAGSFWMGCNEEVDLFCDQLFLGEYPYHEVYLDAFEIDMFEVTQAQYYLCYIEGTCTQPGDGFDPETMGDFPVVDVSWEQSKAFCEWAGKRLCTEAEWEKAARGTDGRRYPWGNEPASCEYAVMNDQGPGCGTGATMPVGSKPTGASPFGPMDMAGNVLEWVNDYYLNTYYSTCANGCSNPQGPDEAMPGHGRVIRGGCFYDFSQYLRTSGRCDGRSSGLEIGFRCCR